MFVDVHGKNRKDGSMESPFANDMFSIVWQAFKNLYPDKDCKCQWVPELEKCDDGEQPLGVTTFADNGEVYVDIVATLPVTDAIEILAHELAHVAVGATEDHGKAWEEAFDKIHAEFDRIGDEMFGDPYDPILVTSGKEYIRDKEIS